MAKVVVAIGSNVSEKLEESVVLIDRAIGALSHAFQQKIDISEYYQTPAFPVGAGPDFINCAVAVETALKPTEVLGILHGIEADMGRERVMRWGQRNIDLDLIFQNESIFPDTITHNKWRFMPIERQKTQIPLELILPHPRIQDRAFVLVPMMDVAPDWVHPILGKTTAEMLAALSDEDVAQIVLFNPNS